MTLPLDHVVINSHFDIERAAGTLQSLGFQLTPQGRHPMGSLNHLIVLQGNYLELIGLPDDGGPIRQEILDNPIGTDGLVFHAQASPDLHRRLTSQNQAVKPIQDFSRPVTIDGQTLAARFRAIRYEPGHFHAGRVYFCEHLTPELIWRPEWKVHANTATRITGVVIVSTQPAIEAQAYATAADAQATHAPDGSYQIHGPDYQLLIVDPDHYQRQYGALACQANGRKGFFGAIQVAVTDRQALTQSLSQAGPGVRIQHQTDGDRVQLQDFNTLIEFSLS